MFGDCDPEGIVYTPRFSYFALEATHEAMHILLGMPSITALKKMGVLTPVRAFDLEFFAPVTWDDELTMNVSVADVGEHSFSFSVEGFIKSDILVFTAKLTHVCVATDTKKVVSVPERLRVLLQT